MISGLRLRKLRLYKKSYGVPRNCCRGLLYSLHWCWFLRRHDTCTRSCLDWNVLDMALSRLCVCVCACTMQTDASVPQPGFQRVSGTAALLRLQLPTGDCCHCSCVFTCHTCLYVAVPSRVTDNREVPEYDFSCQNP